MGSTNTENTNIFQNKEPTAFFYTNIAISNQQTPLHSFHCCSAYFAKSPPSTKVHIFTKTLQQLSSLTLQVSTLCKSGEESCAWLKQCLPGTWWWELPASSPQSGTSWPLEKEDQERALPLLTHKKLTIQFPVKVMVQNSFLESFKLLPQPSS